MTTHIGLAKVQARWGSSTEKKRTSGPTLTQDTTYSWYIFRNGKLNVSNGRSLGMSIIHQVRLHAQEYFANTEWTPRLFVWGFTSLFFACFYFYFLLFLREKKDRKRVYICYWWIGKRVDLGRAKGGKTWSKYIIWNILN